MAMCFSASVVHSDSHVCVCARAIIRVFAISLFYSFDLILADALQLSRSLSLLFLVLNFSRLHAYVDRKSIEYVNRTAAVATAAVVVVVVVIISVYVFTLLWLFFYLVSIKVGAFAFSTFTVSVAHSAIRT